MNKKPERKPYEKPRIIDEKKIEVLAATCGGLEGEKGAPGAPELCVILHS